MQQFDSSTSSTAKRNLRQEQLKLRKRPCASRSCKDRAMNCKFYMGLSVCPTEGEAVSDNPPAHPLVRALQGLEPVPCLWLKDTQSSKNMKIQNDTGNDTENDTEIYRGKYKKCISQARRSKQRRTWRMPTPMNPGWHLRLWKNPCYVLLLLRHVFGHRANKCE